jgi:hypothetical protein
MAAKDIFGKNLGSLKGKPVQKAAIPINEMTTSVPESIADRHKRR